MKIAFDLDGTLWSYQQTFVRMKYMFEMAGHKVGILTEHLNNREGDVDLLRKRGFGPFAFYIGQTDENVLEGEDDASWKLRMIAAHNIDLVFDDCGNENDGEYHEMMDSGCVVFVKPRLPLSKHFD